ncbi:hypothetical protein FSB78_02615 [Sphingomonas ginsenosidivorax]|uniref:Uncharacterized protein n=1 Tax=Sphingomonas ginsenosidivorax TaxID=862135 RepID=A0A5C6UD62_9SPHN|nr:hypothetical protein [Sphingomonas ginsenosidivorax]TXC69965.1 hypothetical protein FSB78_02615 [Sphingomonas ginsenosidivorax]
MLGLFRGARRRRIVNDFVAVGATRARSAIPYDPLDAATFRRLRGYGVIVDDGHGRYHLDATRLGLLRGAVRRRAAAVAGATGLLASAAAAMTVFALAE